MTSHVPTPSLTPDFHSPEAEMSKGQKNVQLHSGKLMKR